MLTIAVISTTDMLHATLHILLYDEWENFIHCKYYIAYYVIFYCNEEHL